MTGQVGKCKPGFVGATRHVGPAPCAPDKPALIRPRQDQLGPISRWGSCSQLQVAPKPDDGVARGGLRAGHTEGHTVKL